LTQILGQPCEFQVSDEAAAEAEGFDPRAAAAAAAALHAAVVAVLHPPPVADDQRKRALMRAFCDGHGLPGAADHFGPART
jgi:hypothetical protein